jgi:hypothetical protein
MVSIAHIEEHINALAQVPLPKLHTFKINEEPTSFITLGRRKTQALQTPNLKFLIISTSRTSAINKLNLANLTNIQITIKTSRFETIKY